MAKIQLEHYSSISALLKACDKPRNSTWKGRTLDRNSGVNKPAFYGNASYQQAQEMALYGWEKGLEQITERLASVPKEYEGRVVMKDIAGSHPDVARFVAGMPDCMNRRVISDAARKPCLDIVANASYASSVNSADIINYGAAIASHIDELENSGYSISLSVSSFALLNGGKKAGFILHLKKHGEMLDLGKMIYFISHPSFQRRLGFSYREAHNDYAEVGNGYGTSCDLPREMQGDLYFPKHFDLECDSMPQAMAYVRSLINAQMPELFTGGQRAA